MNEKKLKEALGAVLQYGWMWGRPRHIKNWDLLYKYYKEELNNGKDFKPDENNRAKA